MYQSVGYNIATFGNHEFNKGPKPVYETVSKTSASNLTWLASNVEFSDAPASFDVKKSAIIEGICWVAAVTEATSIISSPGENVTFTNPSSAIQEAVKDCGLSGGVIAVTHLGFQDDVALCHALPELDLVIGGHSHSDLASGGNFPTKVTRFDGSTCWVVTAAAFGRFVGMIDVDTGDNDFSFNGYSILPLDSKVPLDAALEEKVANYTAQLDESTKISVGRAKEEIDGERSSCRGVECQMGNLVCDSMLAYAGPKQNAVACIQNGGGIRASINKGKITLEEVLAVLPFGNVHATITLPGSGIIEALENGFSAIGSTTISGRFPQVGGMVVNVDYAGAPGSRVKNVTISGKLIDNSKLYTIVTNSFMASGGDGYEWNGATSFELSGRGLDTLAAEYLTANKPYTPFTEGRIVDVSSS